MKSHIYLDHSATTPADTRVVDAMLPYFYETFGNPGSLHIHGLHAKRALEKARASLAEHLGAEKEEIIFTSGGTESNNLALKGAFFSRSDTQKTHIITTPTEHKSILITMEGLKKEGAEISYVPVDSHGRLDMESLRFLITKRTLLVSVMMANNEIGTISPIEDIAALCADSEVLFHTDAVQGLGKVPFNLKQTPLNLLSGSGHKIYGPKGVGLLYVKNGTNLSPQVVGGGQEFGLRSGTSNVPGAVGLAKAFELANSEMHESQQHNSILQRTLWEGLQRHFGDRIRLNGPDLGQQRLSNNLNVVFSGVNATDLINRMKHISLSTGSACTSTDSRPSHVLSAIGLTDSDAKSSIRFGIGKMNSIEQINEVVDTIATILNKKS